MTPRSRYRPLARDFFERPTDSVARDLLGAFLVVEDGGQRRVGRIVETEAYDGFDDRASHASKGATKRNQVMFGPAGHSYVYLIYGMYNCLNVVTAETDYPAAVLIRAVEPVEGTQGGTNGPGRLTRAMGIDRRHNLLDATAPPLYYSAGTGPAPRIVATPRIGVDYAGEWAEAKRRFIDANSEFVSRPPKKRPKNTK